MFHFKLQYIIYQQFFVILYDCKLWRNMQREQSLENVTHFHCRFYCSFFLTVHLLSFVGGTVLVVVQKNNRSSHDTANTYVDWQTVQTMIRPLLCLLGSGRLLSENLATSIMVHVVPYFALYVRKQSNKYHILSHPYLYIFTIHKNL